MAVRREQLPLNLIRQLYIWILVSMFLLWEHPPFFMHAVNLDSGVFTRLWATPGKCTVFVQGIGLAEASYWEGLLPPILRMK